MDGSTGWGAAERAAVRLAVAVLSALLALIVVGGALREAGLAAAPLVDDAPAVVAVNPSPGAHSVRLEAATDGSLAVSFSEPVTLTAALELVCSRSQSHSLVVEGGPTAYSFLSDQPFLPGDTCTPMLVAERISDHDRDDPPDHPLTDYAWTFRAESEPILINEIDAVTADGTTDFIELYDGGQGDTDLSGLTLVLYQGDEATVYLAVGLDGYRTDEQGYFVAGAAGTPGVDLLMAANVLRDGPDAVAVYDAPEADFPRNAPLSTEHLVDAVVYGPAGANLLVLLDEGQEPLDEDSRGIAGTDSSQRCPNGGGRPRQTESFSQNRPTAGANNDCQFDSAPEVITVSPAPDAVNVALDAQIELVFSEPVQLSSEPITLNCESSGGHRYTVSGEGTTYRFIPDEPLVKQEVCRVIVLAEQVSDVDDEDPPDVMTADVSWQFETILPVAEGVLINEVDADTPGVDAAEFIELYDGGAGHTSLDGLALVLFNGSDDSSYHTLDLDGHVTDAAGYFVVGNAAVTRVGAILPDGTLQNGPDAVALVAGNEGDYPNGTPVTATIAIDAIVYSRPDDYDAGLQMLLLPDQPQIDENGRGAADAHSNQRCPNGAGGPRQTVAYKQNVPTPGVTNDCITDTPPEVVAMSPGRGATGVSVEPLITVEFNEPVNVKKKWFNLECDLSGKHTVHTSGGPTIFTITLSDPLAHEEECTATIVANQVNDRDLDDPPDVMTHKKSWTFTTAAAPADFVLINEIDPDTPGTDEAEFIELYDGGTGHTALDGLTLVFFNGSTNLSYRAIDLDGAMTDNRGYLLVGNAGVGPDIVFANGALQNGPDAVALYAADASHFPTDSPIRPQGLLDAIVYGEDASPELMSLLVSDQEPVDEADRGSSDLHSLQRCPNGAGGQRETENYLPNAPTPGDASNCLTDEAPQVSSVTPANGAAHVSIYSGLAISFSEPMILMADAVSLTCASGGSRELSSSGGPQSFIFTTDEPLLHGDGCQARILAARVSDVDMVDPPDHLAQDYTWSFATGQPPADNILINEVDADTPGSDSAEYVELYDGGIGHTDLAGLVLVLFNGNDDRSYFAIDLAEAQTNGQGYLVVGNSGVAGSSVALATGILQNGADAVALYAGSAADFPAGTALHTQGLIDAVVYGTDDPADGGLLPLLLNGEGQIDEAGRGPADVYSSGRCPDGAGGQRRTAAFRQDLPTPGTPNGCVADAAPAVATISPNDKATDVTVNAILEVAFTEDVEADAGWYSINCETSGGHMAQVSGGPRVFTLAPHAPFAPQEKCGVVVLAAAIHDTDGIDPPDQLTSNYEWSFTTAVAPPDFVLINEVDPNTPGSDTQEFIELYDGGAGKTDLSGLVVVFWNGSDDLSYRAIDLDGYQTDAGGYLLLGNAAVPGVDVVFSNGMLQNGPDAVALLAGNTPDFPSGTPLPSDRAIDAIVYGPVDSPDNALLTLLDAEQAQIDEAGSGAAEDDSLQRCPDGAGGPRRTTGYRASTPTPGERNQCLEDSPPEVLSVEPIDGATGVSPTSALIVRFSEDVAPVGAWFAIDCTASGAHTATTSGGPREFTVTPNEAFNGGESCAVTLSAEAIHDSDGDDPPDTMASDYQWSFQTASAPAEGVLINEIDSNTPGTDRAEFIELFDGGAGHTPLDGLVLVLWNGSDDRAYRAIDLSGHQTDGKGYFVLGNVAVEPGLILPGGALQNGPDAVGLYAGRVADFPAGVALTVAGLRDAVVYGSPEAPDAGLLPLLEGGQPQVDEAGRSAAETDSLQRCPDGAGGPRHTAAYRAYMPTPGATNQCPGDAPPAVLAVTPSDEATDVSPQAVITISFSEDITPVGNWASITCAAGGLQEVSITGGPRLFTVKPVTPFTASDTCTVTIDAQAIHDADTDDPPDTMTADYSWRFYIAAAPPAGVLINELDPNTPGQDRAEFIELFDGGAGQTALDGLVVVFWNGHNDQAYRAIDLAGQRTDQSGYFVLGNPALQSLLTFGGGILQNGPDAVVLYAGNAADFPAGSPLTTDGLIDAVVYGPVGSASEELMALLMANEPQVDENGRGAAEDDALQRCPDGGGGPRHTAAYRPATPSPGAPNDCVAADAPPGISSLSPQDGDQNVAVDATLAVTFDEDVSVDSGWLALSCATSGSVALITGGGPRVYTLTPTASFAPGEACLARLTAAAVHDTDTDDPPDALTADVEWTFYVAPASVDPPLASFTATSPLWVGQAVQFTNTSTGDAPLSYVWDFGDGSPPSSATHPVHRYSAAGAYNVTLTASNSAGQSTATAAVEVRRQLIYMPFIPVTSEE